MVTYPNPPDTDGELPLIHSDGDLPLIYSDTDGDLP